MQALGWTSQQRLLKRKPEDPKLSHVTPSHICMMNVPLNQYGGAINQCWQVTLPTGRRIFLMGRNLHTSVQWWFSGLRGVGRKPCLWVNEHQAEARTAKTPSQNPRVWASCHLLEALGVNPPIVGFLWFVPGWDSHGGRASSFFLLEPFSSLRGRKQLFSGWSLKTYCLAPDGGYI